MDLLAGELVFCRAEFAGDGDAAIGLAHLGDIGVGKALEEAVDALARAAAAGGDFERRRHAHALFVKQPQQQALRRQGRIDQLVRLDGCRQRRNTPPVLVVIAVEPRIALLGRLVGTRIRPLPAHAERSSRQPASASRHRRRCRR